MSMCLRNRSWSSTASPSLVRSVRTLSLKASKPVVQSMTADPPPPSTTADPPSFFQSIYDQLHLLLRSLHEWLFVDVLVLFPRLAAFVGTLHLTSEYGVQIYQCEGPSMEPTIIDGSHTSVLLDCWSHRLFGLETSGDATERNCHRGGHPPAYDGWHALLSGIWEQHFASGLRRGDVVILRHPHKDATICKRIIGMPGDAVVHPPAENSRGRAVVSPGHLWLEGDNPRQSLDSRNYGAVPASLVIGKVICRLWPLREYCSLRSLADGTERRRRVSARIGRGARPLPGDKKAR